MRIVGFFRLLHEKLQAGWKENLKNINEQALLLKFVFSEKATKIDEIFTVDLAHTT